MSSQDSEISAQDTAVLKVVDLSRLLSNDPEELDSLLSACEEEGFFYLNMNATETKDIWAQTQDIFAVVQEYFDQPLEKKLEFDAMKFGITEINGYKPKGTQAGIIEGGRDGFESWKIPRDGIFNLNPAVPFVRPDIVDKYWMLFQDFMSTSHFVGTAILAALSNVLSLEGPARFENCHHKDAPSNCALGMNGYPKQPAGCTNLGHNAHTDVGSITLLFCSEWGLQVFCPKTRKWAYVAPRASCAIVNIADSLQFLSGHRLRSSLHRVVPYPGCEEHTRYSFAYFLRPSRDTILRDLDGKEWTAQEWQERKYVNFRGTHSKQRMSSLQTGQIGLLGLWNQCNSGISVRGTQ